jgi:dihydroflavonol-4-reductase
MARTLVTGATGFLGSHVVPLLLERGDDICATVRASSRTERLDELGVRTVRADILDRRAIRRAMHGAERVFHMAGTIRLDLPRTETYAIIVEGTRIVLEEALRAGVERVVLTSSVGAIGPAPRGLMADEGNVWDAGRYRIPYVDAKHEAEAVAMRLLARGLPLVIVNPSYMMGAGDPGRSSTTLVRRFLRRQIPAYVDGTINIVGAQDVARGHILADQLGALGERYILGNRNYTVARLFADLARLSGVAPPPVKLSPPVALAMVEAASHLPGGGPPLPHPAEIRASSLNWAFSNRKAKRELRWKTSPHEDSLEETIAWWRERDARVLARISPHHSLPLRAAAAVLRRLPV